MIILGLTGSIGMGKTVAAGMFERLGVPVHDADAAVHRLLAEDRRTVAEIGRAFPGTVAAGTVDREALARQVFGKPDRLDRLEDILHPAVRRNQCRFLQRAAVRRVPIVALDVPLLFETGLDDWCDLVAVVWAPARVQEARVRARRGMTAERLAAIRARQMSDTEKKARADFLIPSGRGKRATLQAVERIVAFARTTRGWQWPWPDCTFADTLLDQNG